MKVRAFEIKARGEDKETVRAWIKLIQAYYGDACMSDAVIRIVREEVNRINRRGTHGDLDVERDFGFPAWPTRS